MSKACADKDLGYNSSRGLFYNFSFCTSLDSQEVAEIVQEVPYTLHPAFPNGTILSNQSTLSKLRN